MNKNKKTTAAMGSKKVNVMDIVLKNQTSRYKVNHETWSKLAFELPIWISPEQFVETVEALRGYRKGMADVMADCIIRFCHGEGRCLTGLPHVDNQLLTLYDHIYEYALVHGNLLRPLD